MIFLRSSFLKLLGIRDRQKLHYFSLMKYFGFIMLLTRSVKYSLTFWPWICFYNAECYSHDFDCPPEIFRRRASMLLTHFSDAFWRPLAAPKNLLNTNPLFVEKDDPLKKIWWYPNYNRHKTLKNADV